MLMLAPAPAPAQLRGCALRWDHCWGERTGPIYRRFACDTNAGEDRLVGSFMTDVDVNAVTAATSTIDLFVDTGQTYPHPGGGEIPYWWRFVTSGSCRQLALRVASGPEPSDTACQDWAQGQAAAFVGTYQLDPYGSHMARLTIVTAVPSHLPQPVHAGREYAAFTLTIRHDRTVGEGACAGCEVPMWVVFHALSLGTADRPESFVFLGPINGGDSNYALWSPAVVPTRRSSWAAVRQLFR